MTALAKIIDARTTSRRGLFLDVSQSPPRPIRFVRWANLDTGEFEAFRSDPAVAVRLGGNPAELVYRGRAGRIRFVEHAPRFGVKPSDQRDLRGSLEEVRRRFATARPVILIPGLPVPECDEPKCHRPAWWSTSTEQTIEPEQDGTGQRFDRGVSVLVEHWCDHHYRAPRLFSLRGVESEVSVTARPE